MESLKRSSKKSGYKILFFYSCFLNSFGDQVLTASLDLVMLWFKGYLVYFRKKMEMKKKHLLLLLGSLLLGGLIGMFVASQIFI